jgi:lipopolysaccharide heptosyltransferase II
MSWQQATRVLCVRLDSIGDVLMTTPAIRALKESVPGRRITLLTSPQGAEAAKLVPEVDEALVYDAPWMKATTPRTTSAPDLAMVEQMRARRFDAAVIFTVYSQNPLPAAMVCYLADIPLRLAHCRENPYQLLTDWLPEREPDHLTRHEVRRQLDLVAETGARTSNERLSLRVPESAWKRVPRLLTDLRLNPERPWAVIHPGASAPSRRYSADGYARAARRLTVEHGWQILFTGSAAERPLVESIRRATDAPSFSLAGRLNLGELTALLSLAPLLISNNTGPVHVAAAAGTPVVDIYALTNPQHRPWQVPHRTLSHPVPCRNCYKSICPEGHHNCLRLITPDQVVAAAHDLLRETGVRRTELPVLQPATGGAV